MAYDETDKVQDGINFPVQKRAFASVIEPKTFAAVTGAPELAALTPVAFNTSTEKWGVWGDPVASAAHRITAASTTATDGTFTITVDDETTAAIAHDAAAAAILSALEALDSIDSGDAFVYDSGGGLASNDGYATIVFKNRTPAVSVTLSLTGNDHTLSTVAVDIGEVSTLTAGATTASDGTYTLTVNGETTAAIDHDAAAAAIQSALEALGGIDVGDVTVFDVGGGLASNDGVAVILFRGTLTYTNPTVSATYSLTGTDHTLATVIAGASANGMNVIRALVWPDAIQLSASGEVLGNVMMAGQAHYDDIVLPSGETQSDLAAALKSGLRERGITIKGLAGTY